MSDEGRPGRRPKRSCGEGEFGSPECSRRALNRRALVRWTELEVPR